MQASCLTEIDALQSLASEVNSLSFGALAFLVTVVAIFIEFGRDKIVVTRASFQRIETSTVLLLANVVIWSAVKLFIRFDIAGWLCTAFLTRIIGASLIILTVASAYLLARFILEIGKAIRSSFRS